MAVSAWLLITVFYERGRHMDEKRTRVRKVAAIAVLALLIATLLSYFIITPIKDAKTRAMLGDPDAFVTDTARSPWIYADENGLITLYPEHMLGITELVIPDAVNGVKVTGMKYSVGTASAKGIKTIVFPPGLTVNDEHMMYFRRWEELETLVFSEGITDLTKLDILELPALKAIYFPSTFAGVYDYCVRYCGEDLTIYYAGTEEEWLAIGNCTKILSGKCPVVFNTPVPEY